MKKTLGVLAAILVLSACQPKDSRPGPVEQQATVTAGVKVVQP